MQIANVHEALSQQPTTATQKKPGDDRQIISRLILQKILSSGVVSFMPKADHDAVSAAFLSETPEKDITLCLMRRGSSGERYSFGNLITTLTLTWERGNEEFVDGEGNAWCSYTYKIGASIDSGYNMKLEGFIERVEALEAARCLVEDIREMTARPLRVLTHNNEQRLERDRKARISGALDELVKGLVGNKSAYRKGLRAGGKARSVDREHVARLDPGTYTFKINDGSRRVQRIKEYQIVVPEISMLPARLRRIS